MDINKMTLTDLLTLKSLIEKKLDRLMKIRDGERGYDYGKYNQLDLLYQRDVNHERLKMVNERIEEIMNFPIDDKSNNKFPTRDDVVNKGYSKAKNADYNYRRVLHDPDHDIYYSGWMDCYDWILGKQNDNENSFSGSINL